MYKAMIKKSKNKKGFTLVELIVVMAILAILAAILIPSVSGMIKRSNEAVDVATARNLLMAGTMLVAENQVPAAGGYVITLTKDSEEIGWGTDPDTDTDPDTVPNEAKKVFTDFIGSKAPSIKNATTMTVTITSAGAVTVARTGGDAGTFDPNSGKFKPAAAGTPNTGGQEVKNKHK